MQNNTATAELFSFPSQDLWGENRLLVPDTIYDYAPNINNNKISCRSTSARSGYKYGKVVDYTTQVHLVDCSFRIRDGERKRVVTSQVKNVHAWIRGRLLTASPTLRQRSLDGWVLVRYDPFKQDYFFRHDTGEKVTLCEEAILIDRALYTRNPN
jgi:hypothetical protein